MRTSLASKPRDDLRLSLAVCAFFSFNIVCLFVNTITNFIFPNTPIDTILCYAIYFGFILSALPVVLKRLRLSQILFVFFTLTVIAFSFLFFPDNVKILSQNLFSFCFTIFPFFLLGSVLRDFKLLLFCIQKVEKYILITGVLYYFIMLASNKSVATDNMSFAYYYVFFVVSAIYSFIKRRRLVDLVFCIVGLVVLLFCGTRGPLLIVAVALFLFVYLFSKKPGFKFLMTIFFAAMIFYLATDAFLESIMDLSTWLKKFGIENRIVEKIIEGELTDSSGRNSLTQTVLEAIRQKPIFGHGLYGDRLILEGSYAHNFVLEIICSFGFVLGGILLFVLGLRFLQLIIRKTDSSFKEFLIFVSCCILIKLFFSGSYLQEPMFFLFLGLLMNSHGGCRINEKID